MNIFTKFLIFCFSTTFIFIEVEFVPFVFAQNSAVSQPSFAEVLMRMAPMFLVVFLVFHFLIIKPQKKKEKDHADLISNLKNGENVITTSGMVGKVTSISDNKVTLEISPGVKVKFLTSHILAKEEVKKDESKK